MKRHHQPQQQQPPSSQAGANNDNNRSAPQSSQAPPLQFDSNMDWPSAEAAEEARDPLPFPTAHIAPCARITTRIYHPPHIIGGAGGGLYAQQQQGQQGRFETVRDVLVEIAGTKIDDMGRPIIAMASPPPATAQASQTNNTATRSADDDDDEDDSGAGFTGAGGGMASTPNDVNRVSVTAAATAGAAATNINGGASMADDDDSMSSGWSTSDSEMSYGDNNDNALDRTTRGGPTRPNPDFPGGTATANANSSGHHYPQEYQPPQRAYLLQRTLREAIYGQVRYGIVLKRRQLPPNYDASNPGQQPMAEWEVTNERCAVKEMSWQHIRKERHRLAEDPIKEVSAMQYLKRYLAQCSGSATSLDSSDAMLSTHLMLPLDLLSDDRYLYSVMPYCDGGELFDRLDQRQKFSEDETRYWMHQILEGLDNLQRAGICHRDMSLENLLVHNDRICLVIDMGMCLRIPYEGSKEDGSDLLGGGGSGGDGGGGGDDDDDDHDDSKRPRSLSTGSELRTSFMSMDLDNGDCAGEATSQPTASVGKMKKCCLDIRERKRYLIKPQGTCGKWHYMTSEIMRNTEPFDGHAVDMWAAGVIMFLMLTGFPPWERACRTDERFKYMSAGYLVQMLTEWDLGLSADAMDLLQRMVWIDPRDRLSLKQVRSHPWMLMTSNR